MRRLAFFHQTALPEYVARTANNEEYEASPKSAKMITQLSAWTTKLSDGLQNIYNTNVPGLCLASISTNLS